jgi:diguanylate cyclase (GGDEF)-like protein
VAVGQAEAPGGGWLRNPAARRLWAVTLACAVLPTASVAIYAAYSAGSLREEHSHARVADAAQRYAIALAGRLSLAAQSAEDLSPSLAAGVVLPSGTAARLARRFVSVSVLDDFGQHWSLLGERLHRPALEPQALQRLQAGGSVLHAYGVEGQQKRVLLLHALDASASRILAAELAPAYLWGDQEQLAPGVDCCVVAATGVGLFCSRYIPLASLEATLPATSNPRAAPFTWYADGQRYPAHSSMVSLARHFGSADWAVVARDRSAADPAPARRLLLVLAAIALLSLLPMAAVATMQVRRAFAPAAMLAEDARQLAAAGPAGRMRVPEKDPLAVVAQAVNGMAARLQAHAAAIAVLGELDRSVLAHSELDASVRMVFDQIPHIAFADTASITVFEPTQGARAHTFLKDYHDGEPPALEVDVVPREAVQAALAGRADLWVHKSRLLEMGLDVMLPQLARHFLLLPVFAREQLTALLALGYRDRESLSVEELSLPRRLADRLGVTVDAARQYEASIRHARFDRLTQLPNRMWFELILDQELARAKRSRQRLAVVTTDLDGLHEINITLGYAAGDEVLREAARRLRACLRNGDTLARIGGSEFVALLPDLTSDRQAMQLGTQMLGALAAPLRIADSERHLSASIGVSVFPTNTTVAALLLRHASSALAHAKQAGGNRVVSFDEQMSHEATRRATLERELRNAVEAGEFVLHYQPLVDLASRRVTAAEALLRWRHPVGDLVVPEHFLAIAEATGLIVPIGTLALRMACAQLCAWDQAGLRIERLALNVSLRQLERADFSSVVEEALRETGLAPTRLELSLEESQLADHPQTTTDGLAQLARLGVRTIIAGFGTGRSSLAVLTKLRVDALKIGHPFVSLLGSEPRTLALVRAVIDMGHSYGTEVIAGGVDTPRQLAHLQTFRCDRVQGNYFSKPLAADEFAKFAAAFHSHPWPQAA